MSPKFQDSRNKPVCAILGASRAAYGTAGWWQQLVCWGRDPEEGMEPP
jgi:hypothetical protein